MLALRPFKPLVPEVFRRLTSSALAFDDKLGFEAFTETELPVVAETGRRGGGIASCFVVALFSGCFSVLELLRFHDRLNFLLRELIDEGVWGSSGLDCCTGTGDFEIGLIEALDTVLEGCL